MKVPGYGRGPLHLAGVIGCYALAIYAGIKLLGVSPFWVALAFIGGIILHDFVLFPFYTAADRLMRYVGGTRGKEESAPNWINYVRVPVVVSGVLLLLYFPIILRFADERPEFTGLSQDPFLYRWLLVTTALVIGAAVAYAMRLRRDRRAPE